MKKRALSLALAGAMVVTTLAGCGSSSKETTAAPEGTTSGDDNEGRGTGGHDGSGLWR